MTNRKVRESAPVQVYLAGDERQRLDRLADQLDVSKSDVIRRGLLALERELLSPAEHPALRLIGIADGESARSTVDAARTHDQLLADAEEASWITTPPPSASGAKRKRRAR
jgi:hypothetical protein